MNRLLIIFLALACVHIGWRYLGPTKSTAASGGVTMASLNALAATVKADDVVMYCTTACPHCAQAKGWLHQYGFAFTECDMSASRQCESEYTNYGATGTPFLVVRGAQMKDGFDSEQFLALLKR